MKTLNYKHAFAALTLGLLWATAPLIAEEEYLSEDDLYAEEITNGPEVGDPLESLNRYTFEFNDFVLLKLVQPVADGYQAITPDPVEEGAKNFFRNIRYPIRLAGNLLQGRLKGAWVETGRFAINTTAGIGGILTPADGMEGFEPIPAEGVGQALGAWGIGEGPYLVLPFLGPSNLRDLVGLVGDAAVHPTRKPFSLIDDWDWEWQTAWGGTEFLVSTPRLLDGYLQMKGSSIDPYTAVKNVYTQHRRAKLQE